MSYLEDYYSIFEIEAKYGYSRNAIMRIAKENNLRVRIISKKKYILREDFEKYVSTDNWYTRTDVCAILSCSEHTFYRIINYYPVRKKLIRKSLFYYKDDIEKLKNLIDESVIKDVYLRRTSNG